MKNKTEVKARIRLYRMALKQWNKGGLTNSKDYAEKVIAHIVARIEELEWVLK